MKTKTAEEIKIVIDNLMEQYRYSIDAENKHHDTEPVDWKGESGLPSYEAAKELLQKLQKYASQGVEAVKLPTVQELRVVSKSRPDTFLTGALYIIDLIENQPSSRNQENGSSYVPSSSKIGLCKVCGGNQCDSDSHK